jgi:hypothetical protein
MANISAVTLGGMMSIRPTLSMAIAALSWLGAMFLVQAANAESADSLILGAAPDEPFEVGIGIQIDQINFVDQKSENFGVVGKLRLEWHDPKLSFDPNEIGREYKVYDTVAFREFVLKNSIFFPSFAIQNQQGRRYSQSSGYIVFPDGRAFYFERFTATLQAPEFDFLQFPLDTQRFYVHIESVAPAAFVNFLPLDSFSKLGDQLGEEAWAFVEYWTEVSLHEGLTGLPSSRFSFGFSAHRHLDYYVVRIFTPLLIFLFVSWATFFLEDYRKRIDIAGANLLIFVAFNFAISSDLPRLGYMTFMDFIVVSMFVVTGAIIVFNVGLQRATISGRTELARKIDAYVLKWIYPLLYVAVLLWAVYDFFYLPSLARTG